MKKRLLLFALGCILMVQAAIAAPAYPYPIVITQPDGTTLTIQKYGDEFFNWTMTSDGYQIEQHSDGYYYYYSPLLTEVTRATDAGTMRASDPGKRSTAEQTFLKTVTPGLNAEFYAMASVVAREKRTVLEECFMGMPRVTAPTRMAALLPPTGLVIIVNFQDVFLQSGHDATAFENMLNKEGYDVSGAIGSARDYYISNSRGNYCPDFVVGAIVTLPNTMEYYGGNSGGSDQRPAQMIYDACEAADPYINFADYDSDGDGVIDNVFVFYAGNNEAEGGSSSSIWPHRWVVYGGYNIEQSSAYFDGVKLYDYACTSECRGASTKTLAGIGTFAHEFGHVLGLPDYYDTDGTSSGGYSVGLYHVSIMCSGSYNSDGHIPPAYGAIERAELGWHGLKSLADVPDGEYSIHACTSADIDDDIWYIPTDEDGEIFMLEGRINESWDEPLGSSGMVITHWDNKASANYASKLSSNNVNVDPDHMYVRYIESYGMTMSSNYALNKIAYPGQKLRDSFESGSYGFTSWQGIEPEVSLYDIRVEDNMIKFTKASNMDQDLFIYNISQNTATVLFGQAAGKEWTLRYGTSEGWSEITGISGTEYQITKLTAGTQYSVEAENSDGEVYEGSFETSSLTDITPVISGISTSYKVGGSYTLAVTNIIDTYDSVVWYLDGVEVSVTANFEVAGTSTVMCLINYSDGSVEKITKEVIVSE